MNFNKEGKIDFSDVLKNFGIESLNETNQATLKKSLKNYVQRKDKDKVTIKFDDTESKVLERKENYDNLVDVIKIQFILLKIYNYLGNFKI
jgi:hypothetical protein